MVLYQYTKGWLALGAFDVKQLQRFQETNMFVPIFILSSDTLHLHASPSLLIRLLHSWITLVCCACRSGQLVAKIMLPTELGKKRI